MRSKALVPALILATAFAGGCDNPSPTGPAMSVPAPSAALVANESVPFDFSTFVPCANGGAGETIDGSGYLHYLETFTANGNNISGKVQFNPQGLSLTGETTGDTYQGTGITQDVFSENLVSGASAETYVNNFLMIGQDGAGNLTEHDVIHITYTANGVQTVLVDNESVTCN